MVSRLPDDILGIGHWVFRSLKNPTSTLPSGLCVKTEWYSRARRGCNPRHLHHQFRLTLNSPTISKPLRVNLRIRVLQVTVIDENNKPLGAMATRDALQLAQERGFDLVEVAPQANPPVCKFLDYGAYQYRLEKQQRKQRANQKQIEIKGIRLSLNIGEHDRDVRLNQAKKFLGEGDKVKVEMILRGRENAHQDLAREIMMKFVADLGANVEQPISRQGKKFFCLIGNPS